MLLAELSTEVSIALIGLAMFVMKQTFDILQLVVQEHLANKRAARVAAKVEAVKVDLKAANGDTASTLSAIAKAVNVPDSEKPSPGG